jgi:hypothetical protein
MPDGQCLDACPAGTFLNGLVCTTCNSGCSTCNSADEHTVKYIKEGQTIPSERKGDKGGLHILSTFFLRGFVKCFTIQNSIKSDLSNLSNC